MLILSKNGDRGKNNDNQFVIHSIHTHILIHIPLPKYSKLTSIQKDLLSANLTCIELVEHYLSNIEKNKDLNVYIEVYEKEAREKAIALDAKLK